MTRFDWREIRARIAGCAIIGLVFGTAAAIVVHTFGSIATSM